MPRFLEPLALLLTAVFIAAGISPGDDAATGNAADERQYVILQLPARERAQPHDCVGPEVHCAQQPWEIATQSCPPGWALPPALQTEAGGSSGAAPACLLEAKGARNRGSQVKSSRPAVPAS